MIFIRKALSYEMVRVYFVLCRTFFALFFGILSATQGASFAPNYAKARLSAKRIFALVDLVPSIDSYSEEGDKPVCCGVFHLMRIFTHYCDGYAG